MILKQNSIRAADKTISRIASDMVYKYVNELCIVIHCEFLSPDHVQQLPILVCQSVFELLSKAVFSVKQVK